MSRGNLKAEKVLSATIKKIGPQLLIAAVPY
jgi:hypothetical protein